MFCKGFSGTNVQRDIKGQKTKAPEIHCIIAEAALGRDGYKSDRSD